MLETGRQRGGDLRHCYSKSVIRFFFKAAGYSAKKKSGKISIPRSKTKLENVPHSGPVLRSRLEPGHFGRSRNRFEGLSPGSGSTLDETEEILNYILFVRSNIDQRLIKKQIPT